MCTFFLLSRRGVLREKKTENRGAGAPDLPSSDKLN